MKNTILFDYISGEILEACDKVIEEEIKDRRYYYRDIYLSVGYDYFDGRKVWFIRDITVSDGFGKVALENALETYLNR